MQVGKNNISQFLTNNNVCFVIPVYQRNYDWKEENCKQLWDDILYLIKEHAQSNTHFLGTICSSGIIQHEKIIIDGQQRITTISLLIKAMYDCTDDEGFKKYLNEKFISNTGCYGIPDHHRIKLQLNTRDDAVYKKLLSHDTFTDTSTIGSEMSTSRIYKNYVFFYDCVKTLDIEHMNLIIDSLEKLIIVELDIENEDPQEIFESLNSTGLDLTDVDLLRNFLLMSLDRDTQKRLYETYWYQIEENVGPDNMIRFFIDYYIFAKKSAATMLRGRKGQISVGHLYESFKEYYKTLANSDTTRCTSPEVTENLLKDMLSCSKIYKSLVFPDKIDMNDMDEISRIIYSIVYLNESVTSRPILMYIMEKYQTGVIDEEQTKEMLNACLSMTFRAKVTKNIGLSSQFVGNMLLRLSKDEDNEDEVDKFWKAITIGNGNFAFPSDDDFRFALMNRPIFDILHSKGMKYLLYSLEQRSPSSKGLPRYDDLNITIEHIMPKVLTEEWVDYLGNMAVKHSDFLNKLGNLTLTNNNSEMSNSSFEEKKNWYSESSFHYTRKLSDKNKWDMNEIIIRSEVLTNKCIGIWTFPKQYQPEKDEADVQNSKRRKSFRFSMIGLQEGDVIEFVDDWSKTATVSNDDTSVEYEGQKYSLSSLAAKLKGRESTRGIAGPQYFTHNGSTLDDLRNEYESFIH